MLKFSCYIFSIILVSSCSFMQRSDDILLARLGDAYLYESEVKSLQMTNLSSVDSTAIIQQYIQNWAQEELLLQKAVLNINQNELEIDKRLEAYRRSLLIHAYEQKLIQQQLDTLVLIDELETYYNQHTDDYILGTKIAKVVFVKASTMAPKLDSLKHWLFNEDSIDTDKIESYSHQYAKRFYNNPSEWITWADFENIFPTEFNISSLSMKKNTMSLEDTLHVYLVRLMDVKEQGEIAPLEYVEEEIKSILLNQRKLKTVGIIQHKLLEDAKNSKQFEIY